MSTNERNYFTIGIALAVGVAIGYLVTKIKSSKPNQEPSSSVKTFAKHHNVVGGVPFIIAEDIREYRELAKHCLRPTDVVLEVGCALGVTTDIIGNLCSDVVGVDLSENQIVGFLLF